MTVDNLIEEVVKLGLVDMKIFLESNGLRDELRDEAQKLISFANNLTDLVDKGIVKGRTEI